MKIGIGLGLLMWASVAVASDAELGPNDWLLNAENDSERFARLQQYTGGFSSAMWEVGERYDKLYEALMRENFDLALYHWEKIKSAIESGYLKRPGREANARALFLDSDWAEVKAAIASKDADKAWQGYAQARTACMACHVAESVPFMNHQKLFDRVPPVRQ